MYFIKRITVDNDKYLSSEIVDHTSQTISTALSLLENNAREHVIDECGKQAHSDAKIIDVHHLNQISEPLVDTMLIYRVGNDSHRLHLYQRKTKIVPGMVYGQNLIPEFKKVKIFELHEYKNLSPAATQSQNIPVIPNIEYVPVGPSGIKVPKQMTTAPMCDVISELKNSPKFKARLVLVNSSDRSENSLTFDHEPVNAFSSLVKKSVAETTSDEFPKLVDNIIDEYFSENTSDSDSEVGAFA